MLKSPGKIIFWYVSTLCILFLCGDAVAQPTIPKLTQRVNDFTNTLSFQEWQEIDHLLKSYEDTTSTQVVVLMVNSLDGESIEEYSNKVFGENKIGQAQKNNGVLFVVAKQDHAMRIEVGYGLEGVLTDAIASQIIRKEIQPHFRANNYFGGIVTGVDAIIRTTKGEYKADQGRKAPAVSMGLVLLAIFFGVFVFLPMLAARRRSTIGSDGHQYYSGWGRGSGGFGGGSFGGGIFGGGGSFGGGGFSGGGGMSGGGGASGSW
jgi:uncharacterized protein